MPDKQPNFDAVQDSSKAALNNASETIDLMMSKSMELFELNVAAAKKNATRQSAYLRKIKNAGSTEELVQVQERYANEENAAAAKFSSDIYALASGACSDLSALGDNSRNLPGDFLTETLAAAAESMPDNAPSPFGQMMQQALRSQIDLCRTCGEVADKAYRAQRESFKSIVRAVEEAAPAVAKGRGKS